MLITAEFVKNVHPPYETDRQNVNKLHKDTASAKWTRMLLLNLYGENDDFDGPNQRNVPSGGALFASVVYYIVKRTLIRFLKNTAR